MLTKKDDTHTADFFECHSKQLKWIGNVKYVFVFDISTCMFICIHAYMLAYMYTCMHTCMHTIHAYMHVYMYAYMRAYICMHTWMHTRMMHTRMYICICRPQNDILLPSERCRAMSHLEIHKQQ